MGCNWELLQGSFDFFSLLFSFREDTLTKLPFDASLIFPIICNLFVLPPHCEPPLSATTSSSPAQLPFAVGKYSYSGREPWGPLDDSSQLLILNQNLFFYLSHPLALKTLHIKVRTFMPLFCYSPSTTVFTFVSLLQRCLLTPKPNVALHPSQLGWGLRLGAQDKCRSAVGAGCTTERGSLGTCVLTSTCQGRVDTWSCPIHLERE